MFIPELRHHCPTTPIILVGTKSDLRNSDSGTDFVSEDKGREVAESVKACNHIQISCMNDKASIEKFKSMIVNEIIIDKLKEKKQKCSIL